MFLLFREKVGYKKSLFVPQISKGRHQADAGSPHGSTSPSMVSDQPRDSEPCRMLFLFNVPSRERSHILPWEKEHHLHFKMPFLGDMLVPWRVYTQRTQRVDLYLLKVGPQPLLLTRPFHSYQNSRVPIWVLGIIYRYINNHPALKKKETPATKQLASSPNKKRKEWGKLNSHPSIHRNRKSGESSVFSHRTWNS